MGDRRSSLYALLREAAAVLAAILAAFALDAWWGNSREEVALRDLLGKVQLELEYNQSLVAAAIQTNDGQRRITESLIGMDPSRVSGMSQDSALALVEGFLSATRLNPSLGATDAAVNSGLLRGGGLESLAGRLESWQALVADLDETGPQMVDAVFDYQTTAINAGVMRQLAVVTGDFDIEPGDILEFVRLNAAGGALEGRLIRFSFWVGFYNAEMKSLSAELDELLEAVRRANASVGAS